MFEEVQLGFFVVGHTHKDIDKSFGYLSKELCVGRLDESFYGFVRTTIHPPTNIQNSWFQILASRLFEGWPWGISWTYKYAFFCGFF